MVEASNQEVFVSYSHDSVNHVERVLALSNKLRSEGVECVLDQYETAPLEGWPRWMDKKIRDAQFVVLVCTESYYKRVMGDEEEGVGLGVRWEGNLIYQHIYNSGSENVRFIPVIYGSDSKKYIPTPLQNTTFYDLESVTDYERLYRRLTGQPAVEKPVLGKRRALDEKPVKTNPAMFLSSPIDIELWDKAKWTATFFAYQQGRPPILGLAFRNEKAARKIFEEWHERYGANDQFEELRISIVEGPVKGEEDGYSVHICSDPDAALDRFKSAGFEYNEDLIMMVSRVNRMNPAPGTNNLDMFKQLYRQYKTYFLAPGVVSSDGKNVKPLFELGIYKSKVMIRNSKDIGENDFDTVVVNSGKAIRKKNDWS